MLPPVLLELQASMADSSKLFDAMFRLLLLTFGFVIVFYVNENLYSAYFGSGRFKLK